jgi:mannosyltransferase
MFVLLLPGHRRSMLWFLAGRDMIKPHHLQKIALVFAVLVLAAATRLVGLTREPFWIDEILSTDLSSGPAQQILHANARDTHPPLYYLGLAWWRHVIGDGEAKIRGYSVLWSLIAVLAILLLGRELCGGFRGGLLAATLLALSPLAVYYAQEARMYAQLMALTTLAAFFLWRWLTAPANEGRPSTPIYWAMAFCLTGTLAAYTHYVGAVVMASQAIFAAVVLARRRLWARLGGLVAGSVVSALLFLPWLLFVRALRGAVYDSEHVGWIPMPGPWDLSGSLVHELVWANAKQPGLAGLAQAALTGAIALLVGYGVAHAARRREPQSADRPRARTSSGLALAFAGWLIAGPVALAWLVSYAYHPIVYLPRFATVVLSPFLVVAALAISGVGGRRARITAALLLGGILATATVVQAAVPQKPDPRPFVALWRQKGPPDLAVFWPEYNARTASYFLSETVVSATRTEIERALQLDKRVKKLWLCTDTGLQGYETASDRKTRDWLMGLGPPTPLGRFGYIEVVSIAAQPQKPDFPLLQRGRRVLFGEASSEVFLASGWYEPEVTFRWSKGATSTIVFSLDHRVLSEMVLEMSCYAPQRLTFELNGRVLTTLTCTERSPHIRHLAVPAGIADLQNVLVIRHPNAASPLARGEGDDRRQLALGVSWLEAH